MSLLSDKQKAVLENTLRQPWFGAITTVLGGAVGALGSIYSQELKSNVPFALVFANPLPVIGFWSALGLFVFCFSEPFGHRGVQARARKRGFILEYWTCRQCLPSDSLASSRSCYSNVVTRQLRH